MLSLTPEVIVDEAEEAVFVCVVDANPIRYRESDLAESLIS